jgi:alkaline phosphatase D
MRDVGDRGLTRRSLLAAAGGGAAAVAAGWGSVPGWARKRVPLARGGAFSSGVAAGVPRRSSASLWTRLHDVDAPSRLRWEIASDRGFRKVVRSGELVATAGTDFTVKPRAGGLKADREYFYRFETATARSEVGRIRTLPAPDSAQPVRIGFWTCQDFRAGYYPSHRALADEDLHLVVCLGDFIYETGGPSPLQGRDDLTGANKDGAATRLEDYRSKYRLYRTDGDLRKLSASHAFAALWDDHEVANNYWRDGQGGRGVAGFAARKAAAYRAWFEHMPIPASKAGGTQLYRVLRVGRTVELMVMDDRQYRDAQPCADVGLSPCPDAANPSRSMLGAEQKRWLKGVTKASDATWKVLANGVMMMGLDQPAPGSPKFVDTWDGYAAERSELVSFWLREGVKDVVVMTGDDHDNYAGVVTPTGHSPGPAGAVEFVVPSVTSQNTSEILGSAAAGAVSEQNARALNAHLTLVDQVRHGYCVLEARPDSLEVAFKHAASIGQRDAPVKTTYRYRVPRGQARLDPVLV